MGLSPFGRLADGREVRLASLSWPGRPDSLRVEIIEYGAAVHRIVVQGRTGPADVVLAHPDLAAYEADTLYLGPIVGRCANRIGGARFALDGRTFHVTANEGRNCLHGGAPGFNKRLWRFEPQTDDRLAVLTYTSPDLEEGFPGRVEVRATFTLTTPDTLAIAYEGRTDRATPLNLSQHLYFNLSGDPGRDILDHRLRINGEAITPTGSDLIPTGEFMPVAGSPFDFRSARRIGEALSLQHPQLALAKGFDHNWALMQEGPALEFYCPDTALTLTVHTDQVGLQVYSGQGLSGRFSKHGAMVFEPQGFPDAVNQPSFPDVVLRPDQVYKRTSSYRFTSA